MPGRIILFGATGYTGTLTAEELAATGVPAVLAGRDRRRLNELAARLGGDFSVAVADVMQPATVGALVSPGDVLVSTVGPFAKFGRPAVRAAIDRGAHYLDSTGEPSFGRMVFEEFGPPAERAGVVLLPAFGYDCVPGHVAGALALDRAGEAAVGVDIGYFSHGGRWSGGTFASLVGVSRAPSFAWRGGALVTERSGIRTARFQLRPGSSRVASALAFGGTEHLALPRSYPRLQSVGTYVGWFGPLTEAIGAMSAGQALLEKLPGATAMVDRVTGTFAKGSTGGPDATARARTTSTFVAVARDGGGAELASVRLHGTDPYTLTARLLVWGALQLRDHEPPPPGARGPVEAFGLNTAARALAGAGLYPVG